MARVLIIDDEDMFHQLLGTLLEQEGHEYRSAKNGAEALSLIMSGLSVDLIVTDLRMPVMTGPQFIAMMRGKGSTTPIIMMTGDVNPPAIDGVRTLAKPFAIQTFLDAVEEALRPRKPVS